MLPVPVLPMEAFRSRVEAELLMAAVSPGPTLNPMLSCHVGALQVEVADAGAAQVGSR